MDNQSDRLRRIMELVAQIAEVLDAYEGAVWAANFKDHRQRLSRAIAHDWGQDIVNLVREIKSWYGGMGSFGDVVIYRLKNGNVIDERQGTLVNDKLRAMRSALYVEIERYLNEVRGKGALHWGMR